MKKLIETHREPVKSGKVVLLPILVSLLLVCSVSSLMAFNRGDEFTGDTFEQDTKWTGDYDEMVKDRIVRVLIPYSKTFFFLDGATQKGLSYDAARAFEKFINAQQKTKHLKVHLIIIPTSRDELLPNLVAGLGDIAIGNLTITDKRKEMVDFSDPFLAGVDEIVVTGKKSPKLKNVFDLSGKEIYVRKSSSYYENLLTLNATLAAIGKLKAADKNLEDEDLLEMLDAGVVPMVVVDSHKAEFWAKIFDNIVLHPDVKVHTGGRIAWAIRKDSPKLKKVINSFVKKNKKGTLHGNMALNKYLKNTKYIKNSVQAKDRAEFKKMITYFKKYGKKYDFPYLLLAALGYQESGLKQNAKSHVGAVGVMQILPSTAKDKNVGIPDIQNLEANIHAGTKYLRFVVNRYFSDDSINKLNKGLFAFASYNAGPAKITRLRKEAKKMGLDPNVWFRNVEVVAAKRIGRETVQYVSNIYKYYVSYQLLEEKGKL